MGHHFTVKENSFYDLGKRINRFPQGAPYSSLLCKILKILFSEREAGLVSLLPIKPFTAAKAAKIWHMKVAEAGLILKQLADRGILIDSEYEDDVYFAMAPPMAGFFEFSLMRYRNDIDQKALSELFYQYLNVEDDFIINLFSPGETKPGRVFVNEEVIKDNSLQILDYERASEVVKTAAHIGVGICYCRHKMEHLGRNCDAPMEICLTFNGCADSLIRHGIAKKIDQAEGLDLLQAARDTNLIQFGENVREKVAFICNCCGCCCEALTAARRFGFLHPVQTTGFIPQVNEELCTGCGKCISLCPVEAMTLVSSNDPRQLKKKAKLEEDACLGCGVCIKGCSKDALRLISGRAKVVTPVNSVHRIVMMAIERGKLQNLIFDNHAMMSHRAMAAILGVILKLPPIKQLMARQQFKSGYLEALIRRNRLRQ